MNRVSQNVTIARPRTLTSAILATVRGLAVINESGDLPDGAKHVAYF